jgi:hypothetical protein
MSPNDRNITILKYIYYKSLKKKYKAREVNILEKVDERIIGGIKVKIGETGKRRL